MSKLKRYEVELVATTFVIVDAESEDEAMEIAEDEASSELTEWAVRQISELTEDEEEENG